MAASLYRNTISGPQERMVGNGEWSIRFAVASRVSDQSSIGPRGDLDQSCSRMRAAISLDPVIGVSVRDAGPDLFIQSSASTQDLDYVNIIEESALRVSRDRCC